jgi:hypothetical protein
MGKVIEFILHAFGKKEEPDSAEEVLLDFLSKKRGTEERASVVEEVDFKGPPNLVIAATPRLRRTACAVELGVDTRT